MGAARHVVTLAIVTLLLVAAATSSLPRLNIDRTRITTSGVSSGGAFATQMQVAYSSVYRGLGVVAGPPYACGGNSLPWALEACMYHPELVVMDPIYALVAEGSFTGAIDDPSQLSDLPVWGFSGTLDTVVVSGSVQKNMEFFTHYGARVNYTNSIPAEHAWITAAFGNPCPKLGLPYLNQCGYDLARDMLMYVMPSWTWQPAVPAGTDGQLIAFQQGDFLPPLTTRAEASLGPTGYLWVPDECKNVECGLHVAFHGCQMSTQYIGSNFTMHSGLVSWATANRLAVLFPQVDDSSVAPYNPKGCWDWWGYTGPLYAIKTGMQMYTVQNMVDAITGLTAAKDALEANR